MGVLGATNRWWLIMTMTFRTAEKLKSNHTNVLSRNSGITIITSFSCQQGPLFTPSALQWRHNERDGVSIHRRLHCLLNCWFRRRSIKTSRLHITGLCAGNSPLTVGFPAQKTSNTENVSSGWRHHGPLCQNGQTAVRFSKNGYFIHAHSLERTMFPSLFTITKTQFTVAWCGFCY